MKKIGFIFFLLITGQFAKAQELPAKEFYLHLEKALTTIDNYPITLTVVEYGCLGSQINWSAKIKNIGDLVSVDFYFQSLGKNAIPFLEPQIFLDTTFTVEKSVLKKSLATEITDIKSRPVFIEARFKISLLQGTASKEFIFNRGEGLIYLLRFNKSHASYFAKK